MTPVDPVPYAVVFEDGEPLRLLTFDASLPMSHWDTDAHTRKWEIGLDRARRGYLVSMNGVHWQLKQDAAAAEDRAWRQIPPGAVGKVAAGENGGALHPIIRFVEYDSKNLAHVVLLEEAKKVLS